jgi:hypothetical protein
LFDLKAAKATAANAARDLHELDRLGGAIYFEANTPFRAIQGVIIRDFIPVGVKLPSSILVGPALRQNECARP